MRIVFVEPYLGGSHRAFAEGWRRSSRHELGIIGLPGAYWRRRLQTGSVRLAEQFRAEVEARGPVDLIVGSDFLDLAGFLGASRHHLGRARVVLYMHEHQSAHPAGANEVERHASDRWAPMANWRSMHAADEVWFNSEHLRSAALAGLERQLGEVPDDDQRGLLATVAARCRVMPVGVDLRRLRPGLRPPPPPDGPLVVWNHRWDADKGLPGVLRVLGRLAAAGVDFRLALLGADGHHDSGRFDAELAPIGDRVVARGHLTRRSYEDWLCRSDVVVAAPTQENFGISVIEAVAAGAVPVVPDAFAYPEVLGPGPWLVPARGLQSRLASVLTDLPGARRMAAGLAERVRRFDWSEVGPQLDAAAEALVARQ